MPYVNSTYPGASSQTLSSPPDTRAQDALLALMRSEYAAKRASAGGLGQNMLASKLRGVSLGGSGLTPELGGGGGATGGRERPMQMYGGDAHAALMNTPPPLKWVYPGGQPLLEMDIEHMTPAQRQAFLPSNSQLAPSGVIGSVPTAGQDLQQPPAQPQRETRADFFGTGATDYAAQQAALVAEQQRKAAASRG